jgi:hypothetical protein
MGFAELSITSNFTFLTGGSHPEEYARRAALLGIEAIAIADVNSVAGVVRAWSELKKIGDEIADRAEAMRDPIGPPKPAHIPDPPRLQARPHSPASPRQLPAPERGVASLPRSHGIAPGGPVSAGMLSVGRLRAQKGELHPAPRRSSGAFQRGWSLLLHAPDRHHAATGAAPRHG